MPRLRAPQRRRQILEVAARVFAERGYRGATTAELAASAGVTEPILYRHFESKRDLFVTLIEEVGREVLAAWRERLDGAADPRARLEVLLTGNPATHARGAGVYRVIFHAMTEPREDAAVATALRDHVRMLHEFLAGELAALQAAGVVRRDQGAETIAWLLVHAAVGAGLLSPMEHRRRPNRTTPALLAALLAE
jgi:AcrR family transcriptional regulator